MRHLVIVTSIFIAVLVATGVQAQVTTADYQRAESFLQQNLQKKLYHSWVEPSWQENANSFIYSTTTPNGTEFFKVDIQTKRKTTAFDQYKLASLLGEKLGKEVKPYELPISRVQPKNKNTITFWANKKKWEYNTLTASLTSTQNISTPNNKEKVSPNGQWVAFIKDGNIFLKEKEDTKEHQLTTDGTLDNGYGHNLSWYATRNDSRAEKDEFNAEVYWHSNSKKFIVPRYDRRGMRRLEMFKVDVEGYQSEIVSYERGLAGDTTLTTVSFYVFDTDTKKGTAIDLPAQPSFLGTSFYFFDDSPHAYHVRYYRGYKTRELFEIDLSTGKTRMVLSESYPKTFVDIYAETFVLDYAKNEFIWQSEKDGWSHLYLHDLKTGQERNQITQGEFYVYGVEHFDSKAKKIWFTAGGVDSSKDPYQRYLYSISTSGKKQTLLTPEEATHSISISPDKKYFIDNYSSPSLPNEAVLRQMSNGKKVMDVDKADISQLQQMGWKPPQPFSMLADDGKTMLYGMIYTPTNFDPNKQYPVIDGTYTGPHTIRTPKTFSRTVLNMDVSLAELGFVVITVDGRGTAYRSKAFHDVSYARLGYGLTDHVYAIKQLAKEHTYMDISRVGIYGHSAGGYDATRALILFPEFYKVGVSSAADHDHRMEKVWWPELYQGFPVDSQYHNQSNITNAHKLRGDLLIATGDLDNNVNPSATYKLAGELTKANKDFELIILPNDDHDTCYWNKYFIRKRWDFFVKHLQGESHPKEYRIE